MTPRWSIERGGGSVQLFGAVQGLGHERWLTPEVRQAVVTCDEFWCETPPAADLSRHPLVTELGVERRGGLSRRLDPASLRLLHGVTDEWGMDRSAVDRLRPWLIAQILEVALTIQAEERIDVEQVLTQVAREHARPVHSEFDVDGIIRLFGEMPQRVELAYFEWTLARVLAGVDELERDVRAWLDGDLDRMEQTGQRLRTHSADLYQRLVADRNAAWVPRIESMLERGRAAFVVVGFGHLVGDGGLPALLAARDLDVVRIG